MWKWIVAILLLIVAYNRFEFFTSREYSFEPSESIKENNRAIREVHIDRILNDPRLEDPSFVEP